MRRAVHRAAIAALLVAGGLAFGSAVFATFHALDPVFSAELRFSLWLSDAPGWTVGAALFLVAAAPVLFDVTPHECCVGIPVFSPLLVVVPAAIVGIVIWYRGRRRPEAPIAWHGPAGRATRRG